jgi:ribosome-binding factor A
MAIPRIPRLEEDMRVEIAQIIHQELKDPDVGFVTITRVELTKDLSHGKVFYSVLGPEAQRAVSQEILQRSARYVHSLLRKRFHLKTIPRLSFRYDPSIAASIEMSEKLERLNNPPPDPA